MLNRNSRKPALKLYYQVLPLIIMNLIKRQIVFLNMLRSDFSFNLRSFEIKQFPAKNQKNLYFADPLECVIMKYSFVCFVFSNNYSNNNNSNMMVVIIKFLLYFCRVFFTFNNTEIKEKNI